jgi:hypothetical protein
MNPGKRDDKYQGDGYNLSIASKKALQDAMPG